MGNKIKTHLSEFRSSTIIISLQLTLGNREICEYREFNFKTDENLKLTIIII